MRHFTKIAAMLALSPSFALTGCLAAPDDEAKDEALGQTDEALDASDSCSAPVTNPPVYTAPTYSAPA
jgi:hypothetical protein